MAGAQAMKVIPPSFYSIGEYKLGEVITKEKFWQYKVDWCIAKWRNGVHSDETFMKNMLSLGWEEEVIQDCLNEFYSDEDEYYDDDED